MTSQPIKNTTNQPTPNYHLNIRTRKKSISEHGSRKKQNGDEADGSLEAPDLTASGQEAATYEPLGI